MMVAPKKIFYWKSTIFLSLGVGLLLAGLLVFIQVRVLTVQHPSSRNHSAAMGEISASSKESLAEGIKPAAGTNVASTTVSSTVVFISSFDAPVRLLIPAIGVNAAIQSVGLSWKGDGSMGVPTNFTDVAWYNKGPLPGTLGSAVIDGHLDGENVPMAVFYNLGKLVVGDLVIVVDQSGKKLQFRVVAIKTYEYTDGAAEVFSGDNSKARLNLITCSGDWIKDKKSYDKRIVVFTELVASLGG